MAEQALVEDALGRPGAARTLYDKLKSTGQRGAMAVPSATNLVALGRFGEARKAFAALQKDQADAG